jgi:hypothetical protein
MDFEVELKIFDEARKLFPARRVGSKRGNETEFKNFIRHKDWKEVLPLLKPAIERQIKWRKETISHNWANPKFRLFIPEWPNFQTWINQRRWEEEFELPSEEKNRKTEQGKSLPVSVQLQSVPDKTKRQTWKERQELLKKAEK